MVFSYSAWLTYNVCTVAKLPSSSVVCSSKEEQKINTSFVWRLCFCRWTMHLSLQLTCALTTACFSGISACLKSLKSIRRSLMQTAYNMKTASRYLQSTSFITILNVSSLCFPNVCPGESAFALIYVHILDI